EGPSASEVGGYYFIYYDHYRDAPQHETKHYEAVRSKDLKHWESINDEIASCLRPGEPLPATMPLPRIVTVFCSHDSSHSLRAACLHKTPDLSSRFLADGNRKALRAPFWNAVFEAHRPEAFRL